MQTIEAGQKIIVALGDDARVNHEVISVIGKEAWGFNVGLPLITSRGPEYVNWLRKEKGLRVFYDAKFVATPNTMAAAVREAADLGVDMITVYATTGIRSVEAAVKNRGRAQIMVSTVLTSFDDLDQDSRATPQHTFGCLSLDAVLKFATDAAEVGAQGVVCSAHEVKILRQYERFDSMLMIVPAIRCENSSSDDQRRIATPTEAIKAGSDFLVIGREITAPPEPGTSQAIASYKNFLSIQEEIGSALRLRADLAQ